MISSSRPRRHPSAPCDPEGRRVVVDQELRGHVAVHYAAYPHGAAYYGEIGSDGVVRGMARLRRVELKKLFKKLATGEQDRS